MNDIISAGGSGMRLSLVPPVVDGGVYDIGARDEKSSVESACVVLKRLNKSESQIQFVADPRGQGSRHSIADRLRSYHWRCRMPSAYGLSSPFTSRGATTALFRA